ncbi:MAG: hypothetical protein JO146_03305, partial [Candidatus Eremiobacteraeota bacterium]|nr:hypothetical protein [Candidatus Eremiobacteraeota bacterium]
MHHRLAALRLTAAAFALAIAACSGGSLTSPAPGLPPATQRHDSTSAGKIKHVVIVVQENRSFNNLFMGFPGAKTSKYGYDSYGQRIKLKPVPLETTWDIDH